MIQADGVKALMEYESRSNTDMFSLFPNTDIHVWPYLRRPLGQAISREEFPREPPLKKRPRREALKSAIALLLPDSDDASKAPASREILFVVAGRTRSIINGSSMNWLTDYFALDLPQQSVVIQYRKILRGGAPLAFDKTYSMFRAELIEDIRANLKPLPESSRRFTIDIALAIAEDIDFPLDQKSVVNAAGKAIRNQARVVGMRDQFRRILDRQKPRHLVMDGASFGGSRAIQVREAKARGIHVSELQHGWIGPSHGAYQFGGGMWDDRLFQYLPDTLLTFGEYWSKGVITPSKTVVIGKPHIEELAKNSSPWAARPNVALVVSSVYRRDEMFRYSRALRDALPAGWKVLVRPHPFELPQVSELYSDISSEPGIEIDLEADVYSSLGKSKIVLGYTSTVMYEALQFDCIPIIFNSPLSAHYVAHPAFERLISHEGDVSQVIDNILDNSLSKTRSMLLSKKADIWEPFGVDKFRSFLRET